LTNTLRENAEKPMRPHYRGLATAVIMIGVTMSAIDTTAVILGLPVMINDLHSDIVSIVWVIMGYLLVITVFGTQLGKFGDMYGRVMTYNLGFAIFTGASVFSGLSNTSAELIAFRIIQGVGGALISSNSGAIIADTYEPKERGKAYGIIGVSWSVGATLGILVGGAFATFLSWRYIFFINLPIGIVGTVLGYLKLEERSPKVKRRMDLIGMSLFGVGLFLILYALTEVAGAGFTSYYELIIGIGALFVVMFALWERRYSEPLIPNSILSKRVFSASMLAALLQSTASFAVTFLIIMYLQGPRGMTPFNASLLYIPAYVVSGLLSPFAGRMADRVGARVIASIGLGLQAVGFIVYTTLSIDSSLLIVVVGSFIVGAGSASFFPANNSAVMSAAPKQAYGIVSGLLRTFANIGMVCSFSVALLVASISIPRDVAFKIFLGVGGISPQVASDFIDGMHAALFVSIGILIIATILSLSRGKEEKIKKKEQFTS
jgi:EmrB/QacA subfamily drug resistance transporter